MRSLLFFLLLATTCCFADDTVSPDLMAAVNDYYKAEMRGDWATVYSFRTNKFRKSVIEKQFTDVMTASSKGWLLKSFTVLSGKTINDTTILKIRFIESPPLEFWKGSGVTQKKSVTINDIAVWVLDGGNWRCKESPSRTHLPFSE